MSDKMNRIALPLAVALIVGVCVFLISSPELPVEGYDLAWAWSKVAGSYLRPGDQVRVPGTSGETVVGEVVTVGDRQIEVRVFRYPDYEVVAFPSEQVEFYSDATRLASEASP